MRVLVNFFHPALEKSRVNRRLAEVARSTSGVTFRDQYELYPAFDIDVDAEQAALLENDLVVFQHPLYWYSVPPLLKQWQDLVLEHGWAYGRTGRALAGKPVLHALSSGGGDDAYAPSGINRRPLRDYLLPAEQTARLCGMRWLPPFKVTGTHQLEDAAVEAAASEYGRLLAALRDDAVDLTELEAASYANDFVAVDPRRANPDPAGVS